MSPGDVKQTSADISKARAVLGYDPRVSIEDGVQRFVEWFRAERLAPLS
jgi:UDP-glucuronate 4-epimerase